MEYECRTSPIKRGNWAEQKKKKIFCFWFFWRITICLLLYLRNLLFNSVVLCTLAALWLVIGFFKTNSYLTAERKLYLTLRWPVFSFYFENWIILQQLELSYRSAVMASTGQLVLATKNVWGPLPQVVDDSNCPCLAQTNGQHKG